MNHARPKRFQLIFAILFIAGILAFLAINGAAAIIRKPESTSYYENRNLASLPEASRSGILDGSYFSALNTYLQDHTVGRNTLLRIETLLNLRLLHRPVVNEVVVRDSVLLAWPDFWVYDLDWLSEQAEDMADRIAKHARKTEEYGGAYYYVAVPHQGLAFSDEFPAYLQSHEDYYRDLESVFFPALAERNVNYLDMWEEFRRSGILETVSSLIDNHYNIIGALKTYLFLMNQIGEDNALRISLPKEEDYHIEWLQNHYIGSRTRKLFDLWRTGEKLGIAICSDEPDYVRYDWASWMSGPRVNHSVYELPDSENQLVSYSVYMGGDWASTVIETERPEKPNILIYGDSFTNPVECLIWHDFNTMYSFDFRYYDQGSLDEIIARLQPDIVVCIRDYQALLNTAGNGQ